MYIRKSPRRQLLDDILGFICCSYIGFRTRNLHTNRWNVLCLWIESSCRYNVCISLASLLVDHGKPPPIFCIPSVSCDYVFISRKPYQRMKQISISPRLIRKHMSVHAIQQCRWPIQEATESQIQSYTTIFPTLLSILTDQPPLEYVDIWEWHQVIHTEM